MLKVTALPNYCNGKLYKHWDSVNTIFTDGILASKTRKDGSSIKLMITENGTKRELYSDDGKIMDITKDGIKRTYSYKRIAKDKIKGQMTTKSESGDSPLITSAKWITENLMPKKVLLTINNKHPQSEIYIPSVLPEKDRFLFKKFKKVNAEKLLASDFENQNNPIPKTILVKTKDGKTEGVKALSAYDNIDIVNNFHINSEELGTNIRTIV